MRNSAMVVVLGVLPIIGLGALGLGVTGVRAQGPSSTVAAFGPVSLDRSLSFARLSVVNPNAGPCQFQARVVTNTGEVFESSPTTVSPNGILALDVWEHAYSGAVNLAAQASYRCSKGGRLAASLQIIRKGDNFPITAFMMPVEDIFN